MPKKAASAKKSAVTAGKTLLIVESPTKAKTITKYLGDDFVVTASVGHIRDLPKSNKNAIDIEKGFVPHYVIPPEKEHVVREMQRLATKAKTVILATDPDREGEAIAWHITQALGKATTTSSEIKRITFHEITKDAVIEASQHPRDINMDLVRAQEARRVLDRLFGYDLSGLIWTKLRYGLSAGRVQSPALRILTEREKEIRAFIPEKFWVLEADFLTKDKKPLHALCAVQPAQEKEALDIQSRARTAHWKVGDISESQQVRNPRPPFTTSTLQQSASSRLGISPSQTMRLAQKLYEAGYITYMRTDSTNLSVQAQHDILRHIADKYGPQYAEARVFKTRSKNAQEAHEAIRPTNIRMRNMGASVQEKKLYELIWERTIATQMVAAQLLKTKLTIVSNDPKIPEFEANGVRVLFDGWMKADPRSRTEDVELPEAKKSDPLALTKITVKGKETEPPHRYSEAGLVKELEKRGIGRPSTYATIIKTLLDRGYVEKEQRSLRVTDTGEVVNDFLNEYFTNYISDSFTAEMEDELDDIAQGTRTYKKTLEDFYVQFKKEVDSKKHLPKITTLGSAPESIVCPMCGGPMIIKLGRTGRFYSCAKFPDCTGALTIEGKELEQPKEIGEECPTCKKGKLIEREGRFGKFISCNRYPKCKYIKKDENAQIPTTGVKCPECKEGEIAERKGRFGTFYSCSRYPDCKFAIKAKPTGNLCTLCGSLMMEGTKTIPERCSNKNCPNHNPHKLKK